MKQRTERNKEKTKTKKTNRKRKSGHRCRPFSPQVGAFIFYRVQGVCALHNKPWFLPVDILHTLPILESQRDTSSSVVPKLRHREKTAVLCHAQSTTQCHAITLDIRQAQHTPATGMKYRNERKRSNIIPTASRFSSKVAKLTLSRLPPIKMWYTYTIIN